MAFRADAAFAKPEIYETLERRATMVPANKSLDWQSKTSSFVRPDGRAASLVRYKSFRYQAKSWTTPRRSPWSTTSCSLASIVTNMTLPSRSVVRFYNKRGTAEPWIKEGKQELDAAS